MDLLFFRVFFPYGWRKDFLVNAENAFQFLDGVGVVVHAEVAVSIV
jgi:hypothetical protein